MRGPSGKWRGQREAVSGRGTPCSVPGGSEQGTPWGPAADSGWKIKAEKIKGETCRKDSNRAASWQAGGGGKPEE